MARVEIAETVLQALPGGQLRGVTGAQVSVTLRGAGPATVYAAVTGGATLSQPLSTVNGNIEGWLEPGSYDLAISYAGISYDAHYEALDAEMVIIDPAQRSGNADGALITTHATPNTYKLVAATNSTRREIEVVNDSDTVIYLRLNEAGMRRLAPNGGSWYSALFTGLVESVCAAPAKTLTVYELLAP